MTLLHNITIFISYHPERTLEETNVEIETEREREYVCVCVCVCVCKNHARKVWVHHVYKIHNF